MKKFMLLAMLVCYTFVGNALDLRIENNTGSSIFVNYVILVDGCILNTVIVNSTVPSSGNITVAHPGGALASYDWGTLSITDATGNCLCTPVNPTYISCLGASVFGCGINIDNWFTSGGYFVVQLA